MGQFRPTCRLGPTLSDASIGMPIYRPDDDAGSYLQATAMYTDGEGSGKMASGTVRRSR